MRLYSSPALREHADSIGLTLSDDRRTHVVLTRDESYGYAQLRETVTLLAGGAELIMANSDVSHPGPDGVPVPETCSLLAALLSIQPGLPHAIGNNPKADAKGAWRLSNDYALIGPHSGTWRDLAQFVRECGGPLPGPSA